MRQADHIDEPAGDQTVPDALLGCWRRNWIRFGDDADTEGDVQVIWLQTASGMGDLRIDPRQTPEQNDSSCGITVVDESTSPCVTAGWFHGETGFAQQTVSSFPEQGWLSWPRDSLMIERAPSGAYVEEWEKLPGSAGLVVHFVDTDAATTTNLYVAGEHYFLAVERTDAAGVHEYSYGTRPPGANAATITLSTLPTRIGQPLPLGSGWHLVSRIAPLRSGRPSPDMD